MNVRIIALEHPPKDLAVISHTATVVPAHLAIGLVVGTVPRSTPAHLWLGYLCAPTQTGKLEASIPSAGSLSFVSMPSSVDLAVEWHQSTSLPHLQQQVLLLAVPSCNRHGAGNLFST